MLRLIQCDGKTGRTARAGLGVTVEFGLIHDSASYLGKAARTADYPRDTVIRTSLCSRFSYLGLAGAYGLKKYLASFICYPGLETPTRPYAVSIIGEASNPPFHDMLTINDKSLLGRIEALTFLNPDLMSGRIINVNHVLLDIAGPCGLGGK